MDNHTSEDCEPAHVLAGLKGPTMAEFLDVCWTVEPAKMLVFQLSGAAAGLVAIWLCVQHCQALKQTPLCLRRGLYSKIVMLPAVIAGVSILALFSPASKNVLLSLQTVYEAAVLYTFGHLMFTLVTHASTAGGQAIRDNGDHVDKIQGALAAGGPRKHFAIPPLCCLSLCIAPHDFSLRHVFWVYVLIQQYVILRPLRGILDAFLLTVVSVRNWLSIVQVLDIVMKVSNFGCLYGLGVLYFSTSKLLEVWNPKRKFLTIKFTLLLLGWQDIIIGAIAEPLISGTDSCFEQAWSVRGICKAEVWEDFEVYYYTAWVVCLEMVFVALQLMKAYPAEELNVPVCEIHHDVIALVIKDLAGNSRRTITSNGSSVDVADPKAAVLGSPAEMQQPLSTPSPKDFEGCCLPYTSR